MSVQGDNLIKSSLTPGPQSAVPMKGKSAAESLYTSSTVMQPQDANVAGNVHGGVIMKCIDNAAGVVAARHARCNAVTASIDRLDFHHPVFVGDILTLRASLNLVGNSSMEVGVRAEAEDVVEGQVRHIASAYLTFVAMDHEGRPKKVPPLIVESNDEIRRQREARERRKMRLALKKKEEMCQNDFGSCEL